jgi:hypothetical protein
MSKRFLFVFVTLALALASAKTYTVTLFQAAFLAGTELKPGDYQLNLDEKDTKVTLKNGKKVIESPVKIENSDEKFGSTTVRYANADGKMTVQEIRLGGTKIKLVFQN